jgi:hypothetical protein
LCINNKDDSKQTKTTQIHIYNLYSGMKTPDCVFTEGNDVLDSSLIYRTCYIQIETHYLGLDHTGVPFNIIK